MGGGERCGKDVIWGRVPWLEHTGGRALRQGRDMGPSAVAGTYWGLSAAAKTDLGSCLLVNCTFRKLPLGKNPLGK